MSQSLVPTESACPFQFKDHSIRTVIMDDDPWFVAKDVCKALAIDWSGRTLSTIPAEWQCMGKLPTHRRGLQDIKLISEPAVYKLAFRSNKPEADEFTNWVASEVLPAIRKTGKYVVQSAPKQPALPSETINPSQQRELQNVIAAKVSMLPKQLHRQAYAEIYGRIKNKYRIAKYSQLPEHEFPEAVPYILNMQLKTAQIELPSQQEEDSPVDPEVLAKLRVDFSEGVRNAKSSWREVMQKLVDVRYQFADATTAVHRSDISSSNDMAQRAFASVDICLDIMTPFFDLMNEMLLIGREAAIAQAEKRAIAVQLWQMQRASNKPKRKLALSQ